MQQKKQFGGIIMKKKWWHEKVAYQIYPKSFQDTNGDGVGDLRGIINRLDYLKELGIDIIWLSPIYKSPFVDQGYDISDYYEIDPTFGTMDEMDELLAEAKKRDMYIVMDLVVNHCSSEHEWFKKAIEDPYGEYGKYFYIKKGRNGKEPNNWRSYFGGSVWDKLPGHDDLYYLHMFAKEQPDLNWENPVVRKEIYKMINWWLDKGLAGFRIDAIINIKKDLEFRDLPPDREDGMCCCAASLEYAIGVHDYLQELKRETFEPHGAFTIGELFNYKKEDLADFIGDEGCFESIFDFATSQIGEDHKGMFAHHQITPNQYRDAIFDSKEMADGIGFMANIIENHDEPRGVSRYLKEEDCNDYSKKMLAGITLMTYGLPFLYQGQEIGMTNTVFDDITWVNDISTLSEYKVALEAGLSESEAAKAVGRFSRDNARTPMHWNSSENGGFTTGTPWLPINPNYLEINVESQLHEEESVLNFYKKLIQLRKNPEYKEVVVYGKQVPFRRDEDNFIGFYRKGKEKTLLVLANYQNEEREIPVSEEIQSLLINNYPLFDYHDGKVSLKGYQILVLDVK